MPKKNQKQKSGMMKWKLELRGNVGDEWLTSQLCCSLLKAGWTLSFYSSLFDWYYNRLSARIFVLNLFSDVVHDWGFSFYLKIIMLLFLMSFFMNFVLDFLKIINFPTQTHHNFYWNPENSPTTHQSNSKCRSSLFSSFIFIFVNDHQRRTFYGIFNFFLRIGKIYFSSHVFFSSENCFNDLYFSWPEFSS